MRRSIVDGQFYPSNKAELISQVKNYLYFSKPGISEIKGKIIGAVAPHAGYMFSGKIAAEVYKAIEVNNKKYGKIDTFIILGTNHTGLGTKISLSVEDFETPIGEIKNNIKIVEEIIRKSKEKNLNSAVSINEAAHRNDHSIEVQIPFIQLISPKTKIVPIVLRTLEINEITKFSGILYELINESKKKNQKIMLVASSDFTHYGPVYHYLPFPPSQDAKEKLKELDNSFIEEIQKLNMKKFYEKTSNSTVCGKYAVACCIEICRKLRCKSSGVRILDYYTSGDISGDYENMVGYAGIIFIN